MRRNRWIVIAPYAAAAGLAAVYQLGLQQPSTYVTSHLLATSGLGLGLLVLVISQVARFVRPETPSVRRQSGVLALAIATIVAMPLVLTIAEPLTGGTSPQNAVAFTAFLLPLAIGWALMRTELAGRQELEAAGGA